MAAQDERLAAIAAAAAAMLRQTPYHVVRAGDVAAAALLIATQPEHSRISEIRMRPMVEPLFGRDPL